VADLSLPKLVGFGAVGVLLACGLTARFAPELSPLKLVGFGGVGALVACWLSASFAAPGRLRERVAWLGATALYVALGCLFLSLFLSARADDSLVRMLAFGFLLLVFGTGLVLALHRLLRAFTGRGAGKTESATN
jgi:hypothetical protein